MQKEPIIQFRNVTKRYGDVLALNDVNLDLWGGQVLGLVGANGSGKTTLVNLLCGYASLQAGKIWLKGKSASFSSPAAAIDQGIRMLSQTLEIYPSLNVLENIFLGQEEARGIRFFPFMDWRKMRKAAAELLERVGAASVDPLGSVEALSGGQKKAAALARMLAREADVLVFDEPMASLGVHQRNRLLEIVAAEARRGRAVIFISHDVEDVLHICDRIVVLRNGAIVKDEACKLATKASIAIEMTRM